MCVRDALRHTRLAENGKISKEVYCLKDLKHLIYFENLLQDAQNELVTQAVNEGKYALGYNCYYIPEVLLNLPGCFSSRLRAPRCTSTDVAYGGALLPHQPREERQVLRHPDRPAHEGR